MTSQIYRAIGLMSGTSIDGIDVAMIETDGYNYVRSLGFAPYPYASHFRQRLRKFFGFSGDRNDLEIRILEQDLTELHSSAVMAFLAVQDKQSAPIDIIGFHGQTLFHDASKHKTLQIGDGAMLARMLGIPVVNDFRSADIAAGGHGAPFVPLYHRAMASQLQKPVAIVNIGGVANITLINGDGDADITACDVGPGNALIDDWVLKHTGESFDEYGLLAASGVVNQGIVDKFLAKKFFRQKPPKSLDRNSFKDIFIDDLSVADGAATLTMITARSIAVGLKFTTVKPKHVYVAGGGRYNNTLMRWIADLANIEVSPVDDLNWSGDGLEAEAFGYLAVRSHLGLALCLPGTTGVPKPTTGGVYHLPNLKISNTA
jgi:anhydro-N-acetylmuramic acid kinase